MEVSATKARLLESHVEAVKPFYFSPFVLFVNFIMAALHLSKQSDFVLLCPFFCNFLLATI